MGGMEGKGMGGDTGSADILQRTSEKIFKMQQKQLSTLRKIKWPLIAQETFPRTHTAD